VPSNAIDSDFSDGDSDDRYTLLIAADAPATSEDNSDDDSIPSVTNSDDIAAVTGTPSPPTSPITVPFGGLSVSPLPNPLQPSPDTSAAIPTSSASPAVDISPATLIQPLVRPPTLLAQIISADRLPSLDGRDIFLNPPLNPEIIFRPLIRATHRELETFLSETTVIHDSSMSTIYSHLPSPPRNGGEFFVLRDLRAYLSDISMPSFFSPMTSSSFCAHYFASRFRALATAVPSLRVILTLSVAQALQMPEQRLASVIARYLDTTLCAYHYLYAEQLQPAFYQTFTQSRSYHPIIRVRFPITSYQTHHTHVVQRLRYIRNCELVFNTFQVLSETILRFSTQLANLSLVSPVSFDYRSV
jgi:hypothetical protein